MNSYHVSVAAEAICAAQFARIGFNVSVQYGANQPEYDLLVTKDDRFMKVSVKGSQDGGWGLTQAYLKDANYYQAADEWLSAHGKYTILCLVQFWDIPLESMPKIYLATPAEIANHLKAARAGHGDTILNQSYTWGRNAVAKNTTDAIPIAWTFTAERALQLLQVNST